MTNQTNETQKSTSQEIQDGRLWAETKFSKLLERAKSMNEETKPETNDQPQTKDQQETPKPKLLVLKTGYGQYASLFP